MPRTLYCGSTLNGCGANPLCPGQRPLPSMSFSGHPPLGNKSPNKADDDGRTETRDVLKKNADAAAQRRNERTTRNMLVWIAGKQWKVGPKGGRHGWKMRVTNNFKVLELPV